jgi:signal transduction histidine kinase
MMRSERLASMATLTAGMAHQLGNHLNAIKGYAALLERQLGSREAGVTADLEAIAREVRAAAALLERTQELGRTRHGARLDFSLGELLRSVREMASLAASGRSVQIGLELPEQEVSMLGDPELLGEALFNLVMNGIQAMPHGGELWLRASQRERQVVITVEDEGEGIPEEIRSRIFDPFFTMKPVGQGTGLGLAIANHIVELHDGEIDVRSEVGKGTIFEVLLPLKREGAPGSMES